MVLVALPKWISPRYKNFDGTLFHENNNEQVKLGFTRACRSIDKLGKSG